MIKKTIQVSRKPREKSIRDGPTAPDDRCDRGIEICESFVLLQISGVEVYSAVGQEAEP